MDKIIHQLKMSERIFIASHINPDGDAVGSLTAMGLALDALGKHTVLYNESQIPTVYRFLPSVERIVSELGTLTDFDTAIILDCGNLERIGNLRFPASPQGPEIINIDHHVTNNFFGDFQLIDTSACATAEIIYGLIKQMGILMDRAMATSIYTGILTDTGSFRFSNTNNAAFKICDEMVTLGVDPYHVAKNVYGKYSLGRIKLLNLALDSIEISYNGRLSMMTVTRDMLKKTGTHIEDIAGLINYARRIEDVKLAVLILECDNGDCVRLQNEGKTDGSLAEKSFAPSMGFGKNTDPGKKRKFHVSLRSDGSVDVATIASDFGGGGHYTAAGFNVESSITELKTGIFNLAETLG